MSYSLRDDIDPATTWITSDTHYGHDNIVGFSHRPVEHQQIMIDEWLSEVPAYATVLHLGDLSYRGNGMFKHVISKKLTARRKLLLKGNHDKQRYAFYRDSHFKLIKPFSIAYERTWVTFDHYPLRQHPRDNQVHVHGHIHNSGYGGKKTPYTPFSKQQINVSVEQTKYRPVNLKCLLDGYLYGCYEDEIIYESYEF